MPRTYGCSRCPASRSWQDFVGLECRGGGVGQAQVHLLGPVEGDGFVGAGLVVLDSVVLGSLAAAMHRRDTALVAVLRSALSALANAEASPAGPPGPGSTHTDSSHVAGTTPGLGATEVPRIALTQHDQRTLLATEAAGFVTRIDSLTRACRHDEADDTRRGLDIICQLLQATAPSRSPAGSGTTETSNTHTDDGRNTRWRSAVDRSSPDTPRTAARGNGHLGAGGDPQWAQATRSTDRASSRRDASTTRR